MIGPRLLRLLLPLPVAAVLTSCAVSVDESQVPSDEPSLPTTLEVPGPTNLQTDAAEGAVAAKDKSFGVAAPDGWANDTGKQPSTVLFLRSPDQAGKIYPSFSVVRTSLKEPPPLGELVEQGMIAQRQKGATVTRLADRTIGGVPAAGYRMTRTTEEIPVTQTQYYLVQNGSVFITTMTSASSNAEAAGGVQNGILNSWSWGAPPAPSTSSSSGGSSAPSSTPGSTSPTSSDAPSSDRDKDGESSDSTGPSSSSDSPAPSSTPSTSTD